MIDEYVKEKLAPATKRIASSTKRRATKAAKNAARDFGAGLKDWFSNFRWIEFFGACIIGGGTTFLYNFDKGLPFDELLTISIVSAVMAGVMFIRSPKMKWEDQKPVILQPKAKDANDPEN